jgi:hypothetical protein
MTAQTIKVGDRVRRIGGRYIGTVCEIAERPSRKTDRQRQTIEMRIRVLWPPQPELGGDPRPRRTWLALSGEGTRWERAPLTP